MEYALTITAFFLFLTKVPVVQFVNIKKIVINKIGWKKNQPCFIKVNLTNNVPKKLLNTSAKRLHNKNKFRFLKRYTKGKEINTINDNLIASIITPDKDIIPNSENLEPAYIVFENYEIILQWNRSLRFGLAVCTLKDKFENVL